MSRRVQRLEDWDDAQYSIIPPRSAIDRRLAVTHFRVLALMGRMNSNKGWCQFSQKAAAEMFGVSRQSVNAAVKDLREWGYLETQTQEQTRSAHCYYRVAIDGKNSEDGTKGVTSTPDTSPRGKKKQVTTVDTCKPDPSPVSAEPVTRVNIKDTHLDQRSIDQKKSGGRTSLIAQDETRIVDEVIHLSSKQRAYWLPLFDNDETALDLAVMQAAGYVQENSRTALDVQISRQLARTARETRERNKRYAATVKAQPPRVRATPANTGEQTPFQIELARRLAAEGHTP